MQRSGRIEPTLKCFGVLEERVLLVGKRQNWEAS